MNIEIRRVRSADLPAVLALNKQALPHVGDVDLTQFHWFAENAAYFKVGVQGDQLAGFLIGLTPEAPYGSPNFRWFSARFTKFMYIDRIVIEDRYQRLGLGRRFYADLESESRGRAAMLSCEVNIEPPNPQSMAFHEELGFGIAGEQETEGGAKRVAMMIKTLQSDAPNRDRSGAR